MQRGDDIVELDRRSIELIVGGEVYVKPLSIVKECVENSLDANASRVKVSMENGGYTKVQIDDDGEGISEDILKHLCSTRHFSTKERDKRNTLGFRGEALSCLSYMSVLRIVSRTDNQELACAATFIDGELAEFEKVAGNKGTSVIVTDIYRRHKVRRNTKSHANAERSAITGYLSDLGVFYADKQFILSDGEKSHVNDLYRVWDDNQAEASSS